MAPLDGEAGANGGGADEGGGDEDRGGDGDAVAPDELAGAVEDRVGACGDGVAVSEAREVGAEGLGGGVAAGGLLAEGGEDDGVEVAGEAAPEARGRVVGEGAARGRGVGVADEASVGVGEGAGDAVGRGAGEELVEDEAEGVDVGGGGDGLAGDLLGAGVLGREAPDVGHGLEGLGGVVEDGGDAEVEEARASVVADDDVGGLEVSVDDEVGVGVLDGGADLVEEVEALVEGEVVVLGVVGDGLAVDELGDEEGLGVVGDAGVEEACDVGVVEGGEDLSLAPESSLEVGVVDGGADELDDDALLVGGVGAGGAVDDAHGAGAEARLDAVAADGAADHGVGAVEAAGDGIAEEVGGGVVGADEGLDLVAEARVVEAIEEVGAPVGRDVGDGLERLVDAFPEVCVGHASGSWAISRWSQLRAKRQSFSTVVWETPRASAVSSMVRPAK